MATRPILCLVTVLRPSKTSLGDFCMSGCSGIDLGLLVLILVVVILVFVPPDLGVDGWSCVKTVVSQM